MEVLVDEISSSLEHGKGKCDENHDMVKEMEDYMDGPSHFLELNWMILEDSTLESSNHQAQVEDTNKLDAMKEEDFNGLLGQVCT
jgi:hypothetical protein